MNPGIDSPPIWHPLIIQYTPSNNAQHSLSLLPTESSGLPRSRRQIIVGEGCPTAAHLRVTLLPSPTIMSWLVKSSKISGGTAKVNYIGSDVSWATPFRGRPVIRGCIANETLTDHFQEAYLTLHGVAVDLAHVPSSVRLLDVLDSQLPGAFLRVTDPDAMVLRDDMVLDGEYCLGVHTEPSYFVGSEILY